MVIFFVIFVVFALVFWVSFFGLWSPQAQILSDALSAIEQEVLLETLQEEESLPLRDWNQDSAEWELDSPKRKQAYLVEWILHRETFLCDNPIECDEENPQEIEIWSIMPPDRKNSEQKEIYLGFTSGEAIYASMPVEQSYALSDFWGFNLRELADQGEVYRFWISYNTPEAREWRTYNAMIDNRKILGKKSSLEW